MSHYTKLAVLIIRLLAVILIIVGGMGFMYQLVPYREAERVARLLSSILFVVSGLVVYTFSAALARLVTRDL